MSSTISLPLTTVLCAKGLPRFVVPRMVPPTNRIPRVFHEVSWRVFVGVSSPSNPSMMPVTSQPYLKMAVLVTARMTALRPGASPPPERTPIRMITSK